MGPIMLLLWLLWIDMCFTNMLLSEELCFGSTSFLRKPTEHITNAINTHLSSTILTYDQFHIILLLLLLILLHTSKSTRYSHTYNFFARIIPNSSNTSLHSKVTNLRNAQSYYRRFRFPIQQPSTQNWLNNTQNLNHSEITRHLTTNKIYHIVSLLLSIHHPSQAVRDMILMKHSFVSYSIRNMILLEHYFVLHVSIQMADSKLYRVPVPTLLHDGSNFLIFSASLRVYIGQITGANHDLPSLIRWWTRILDDGEPISEFLTVDIITTTTTAAADAVAPPIVTTVSNPRPIPPAAVDTYFITTPSLYKNHAPFATIQSRIWTVSFSNLLWTVITSSLPTTLTDTVHQATADANGLTSLVRLTQRFLLDKEMLIGQHLRAILADVPIRTNESIMDRIVTYKALQAKLITWGQPLQDRLFRDQVYKINPKQLLL